MTKRTAEPWPGWISALIESIPTKREDAERCRIASLSPRVFMLWVALARFADNQSGVAWPSVSTLMRLTGLSRRSIFEILNEGEGIVWERIETDRGHRGGHKCNATSRYQLLMPPTAAELSVPRSERVTQAKNSVSPVREPAHDQRDIPHSTGAEIFTQNSTSEPGHSTRLGASSEVGSNLDSLQGHALIRMSAPIVERQEPVLASAGLKHLAAETDAAAARPPAVSTYKPSLEDPEVLAAQARLATLRRNRVAEREPVAIGAVLPEIERWCTTQPPASLTFAPTSGHERPA